ncbi:hypothetical protein ENSA5_50970 [Enhygromyxa salina]|uniref:YtkA-like domain-containing protein n=1 Tax=Enhygromyxa salina TaxID=215803 RepID=A0A2S9XHD7_9BACT|nr:hypothetical protein [Enhygromyxa salina]PRP92150.1 hypothetical protein ENSA5_50970 [Enhygromyxa salina]
MPRHPLLRSTGLTLALFGFGACLAGCDVDNEDLEAVDARAFEEGVAKDTEGGAFRVVLYSRDGLTVGAKNTMIARVGFHDPNAPEDPGLGIPGAELTLDAHLASGEFFADAVEATYIGEGRYQITGLELPEAGVWQFDFYIAVGETIDESVAFVFEISE